MIELIIVSAFGLGVALLTEADTVARAWDAISEKIERMIL